MIKEMKMAIVPNELVTQLMTKIERLEELLETKSEKEDNSRILSPEETAKMLRVSSRTLQTYRDNGLIPFSQYDRKIWFLKQDVMDFLDSHRIERRGL